MDKQKWVEYLSYWSDDNEPPEDPNPDCVIFADYSYEDYYGDAFYVYIKDGIVYEGHGSHCSCHGLEGQFEPEVVGTLDFAIEYFKKKDSNCGKLRYGAAESNYKLVISKLEEKRNEQ